jgi:hypothetical protein
MDTASKRKKTAEASRDIGTETRLALYRMQVELRYCEKRAYDLFLQNLIKGTSHLSLGQEAVAAGFGVAMRPDDWSVLYNAACFYSSVGEHERALDLLERALNHGGGYLEWMRHDTDLDPLRGHPRFEKLMSCLHDRVEEK